MHEATGRESFAIGPKSDISESSSCPRLFARRRRTSALLSENAEFSRPNHLLPAPLRLAFRRSPFGAAIERARLHFSWRNARFNCQRHLVSPEGSLSYSSARRPRSQTLRFFPRASRSRRVESTCQ